MDIITIIQAVLRRWYVTVPVMLAAFGLAYSINSSVEPTYQARGEVLLASPQLDPSGLPQTVTSLPQLASELGTDAVQGPLLVGGVGLDTRADGNALTFTIDAGSDADARATATNVIGWVEQEVEARQEAAAIDPVERLQVRSSITAVGQDPGEQEIGEDVGAVAGSGSLIGTVTLNDPVAGATNPFGATGATARVLSVTVQSDAGRQRVAERAGDGILFELGQNPRDPAPIVAITTYGSDPDAVLEAFDHVSDVMTLELNAREERADVPPSRQTRLEPLSAPASVTNVSPPIDRSVATIIGLGGLIAIALAILTESILDRRRRREDAAAAERLQPLDTYGDHDPRTERIDAR